MAFKRSSVRSRSAPPGFVRNAVTKEACHGVVLQDEAGPPPRRVPMRSELRPGWPPVVVLFPDHADSRTLCPSSGEQNRDFVTSSCPAPIRLDESGEPAAVRPRSRLRLIGVDVLLEHRESLLCGQPPAGRHLILDRVLDNQISWI